MYIKDRCMVYMIDREFNIIHVPHLTFPSTQGQNSHIKSTILDGEFVLENDQGVKRPRYLIFDLVVFNNEKVNLPFSKRLKMVHQEIIAPRDSAFSNGTLNRTKEAFSVRIKQFFQKNRCKQLYERFMKNVTHETDGLVFQPENDVCALANRASNGSQIILILVLSVKGALYPLIHRCLNEWEGNLYVMGHDSIFAKIKVSWVDGELRKYDKRIIECNYDKEVKRWKFLRVREDKYTPNWITTALSVCATIQEPVTIEDVYKAVEDPLPKIVCSSYKRKPGNDTEQTGNVE
ncbi:hypothetical protein MXB_2278 [Myxobolus squamalis]|nr:hypothetical protein MXB_2278 [Myxobolus squamalis]